MSDVTAVVTCLTDMERPYIDETICAVLAQTYPCKVVVILSEESRLFGGLEEQYPHVSFVRTKPQPPGAMRNLGISYADTEWVAYCDGDDVWEPSKIAEQLHFARQQDADLVGCDSFLVDEACRPFAYALSHHIPATSSWLVRSSLMRECPFDEQLMLAEDGRWWSDFALNDKHARAYRLARFLLRYRVRGHSLSTTSRSGQRKRAIKRIAELSIAVRHLVMAGTWLLWRTRVSNRYVASDVASP